MRDFDELWDDYLQYLIWRCGLERLTKFGDLFSILHRTDFRYILDRDDNRDEDGAELREDYNIPTGYSVEDDEYFYARATSVMEMLVALSIRVDNEYIGDPAEEHPEDFFMEMIKNLGLGKMVDKRYSEKDVLRILDRWMDRKFEKNGRGSPFPVKYDPRDQRKLEIWDQMNSYISENYE